MIEGLAIQGAVGVAVGLLVQLASSFLNPQDRHRLSAYSVYGLVGLVGAVLPSFIAAALEHARSGQASINVLLLPMRPVWAAIAAFIIAIPTKLFERSDRSVAAVFVALYVAGWGSAVLALAGGIPVRLSSIAAFAGFLLGVTWRKPQSGVRTSGDTSFNARNWLDGARFAAIGAIAGAIVGLLITHLDV